MKKILVLSSSSLLAQGVISRLSSFSSLIDLDVLDLAAEDLFQRIIHVKPDIVIYESSDLEAPGCCLLSRIINFLPDCVVLKLQMSSSNVQVIQSARFSVATAGDLLELFQDSIGSLDASDHHPRLHDAFQQDRDQELTCR
jgi:DNA-binding NarL/FixJ family response regulator